MKSNFSQVITCIGHAFDISVIGDNITKEFEKHPDRPRLLTIA
ncbi:hypothetical protein FHW88_006031 [Mucilaginibacter sp. SG538B]|nr:hypothetical protein [Mucilaginibacter sp. SG538B]NVM67702.1 hypothetical protein [Mucilaginibacter sp. SG538B]